MYGYFEGSNIYYEIDGQATLPDTIDVDSFQFREEQVMDWEIIRIVWRDRQ